jgi:DNA-binding NtrC family response regulator
MPSIQLTDEASRLLISYRWPGNIRQLKNVTEQISIIETNRDITPAILQNYLPVIPDERFPVLPGVKGNFRNFENERDILYQVLFDMRKDITELKKLVHDVMNKQKGMETSYTSATPIGTTSQIDIFHPVKITREDDEDIQDTEEYTEETLSLDEMEKEIIRKALGRHHGKRKHAAKDLDISERTLYRKIKEYGLE